MALRLRLAAVHTRGDSLETNTPAHFGLTTDLIRKLRRDRLTVSRLQQLLDDETAKVTRLDTNWIETVVVTDGEIRIATPGVDEHIDIPVATLETGDLATALATAYEQRGAAGDHISDRFADVGWRDMLAGAADTFDEEFRDTLAAATDRTAINPDRGRNSLVGILCLIAAYLEHTQKDLCRFMEALGVASSGTVTNMAAELEAAGLIEREPVDVDWRGRPPKRLLLADETLDPTDFVDQLPD